MAIHGAYSYGAQNRGFVAGSQTGLTGGLVLSVAKATSAFAVTFYIVEEQRLEKFDEVATYHTKGFTKVSDSQIPTEYLFDNQAPVVPPDKSLSNG